ncbi:phospholipase D-like domain-containing protein [Lysobacter enzymogenes]|uniref:phospholipase D-like domain-containing protein n=1 Tax=Lysobacter enzymogenes TaxID=69 RepID=UPI001A9642A2|nr:phospholipase D family protein [Lysobacter enzymogenes]QQP96218.1 phospholipase D family protein [Lysobacter enzymogenes]
MKGLFANRNSKGDFVLNEIERLADGGGDIYIASAFFTDAELVLKLLDKGCRIHLVIRLGFPTDPDAIDRVLKHPQVQLRCYTSNHYHPKLYLFGTDAALVGSANLTRSAMMRNQEVMLSVEADDERLHGLIELFEEYWDSAEVPTDDQLKAYRSAFREYDRQQRGIDELARGLLSQLGDSEPENIERTKPKRSKSSLFASSYRRAYQESVAAFDIVRDAYRSNGYRKADEAAVPLRIEIDSFISFVRERYAIGESWRQAPRRSRQEQHALVGSLMQEWRQNPWPHFEQTIVAINYPRLTRVFASPQSIRQADDSELFDALSTLHSFHDRFRFFAGGMATWRREFPTYNDPVRTRDTLAYLVHGSDHVVDRMANVIYSTDYKLNEFGTANVQELIGWCNREDLPILNGRTTKVLNYFGSEVRQLS